MSGVSCRWGTAETALSSLSLPPGLSDDNRGARSLSISSEPPQPDALAPDSSTSLRLLTSWSPYLFLSLVQFVSWNLELTTKPRLPLNSQSCCLCLPSTGNIDILCQAWLIPPLSVVKRQVPTRQRAWAHSYCSYFKYSLPLVSSTFPKVLFLVKKGCTNVAKKLGFPFRLLTSLIKEFKIRLGRKLEDHFIMV